MISSAGTFLHFSWYDAQVRAMLFTKRASPNFVKEMKIKSEYSWETLWFISETNALCVPCRCSSNFYDRLVLSTLWMLRSILTTDDLSRRLFSMSQIRLPTALKESQSSKMLNYTILLKKTTQQSSLPSTIMRALMKIPLFAFQSLKHILIG